MILRGIDFGHVMNASGARNFFGQGYWFHPKLRRFGLDYTGSTFVAKTTTLAPRAGNMPFTEDLHPKELFPRCIFVDILRGAVLNAVGLSGPGAGELLRRGEWQKQTEPFFISFAAVAPTADERLKEWQQFAFLLLTHRSSFHASMGLEMNFSCPNTGVAEKPFVDEVRSAIHIMSVVGIPLVPKLNVLISPAIGAQIAEHSACDAICQSNTIPWDSVPDTIKRKFFGRLTSPLKKYGGGGLSGPYLFPLVMAWISQAVLLGFKKPIIGCGGIYSRDYACAMFNAGASAIQIGSVSITRPWRVKSIIECANQYRPTKQGT